MLWQFSLPPWNNHINFTNLFAVAFQLIHLISQWKHLVLHMKMWMGLYHNQTDFWCQLCLINKKVLHLPSLWILTIVFNSNSNTSFWELCLVLYSGERMERWGGFGWYLLSRIKKKVIFLQSLDNWCQLTVCWYDKIFFLHCTSVEWYLQSFA
jgi:hypothetical protein